MGINGINVPTDDPAALGTRVPYDYQVTRNFYFFLYQYKSTNTDADDPAALGTRVPYDYQVTRNLLALLVQMYKY